MAFLVLKAPFQIQQSSTTTKERLLKPKYITYRKPKLSTTSKQVSKSLLNTTSSAAHKAIQGLANHQSETNKTTQRYINIMEAQQSIIFIFADIKFSNRRMRRENQSHARLVETGEADGYIRIALGWIEDYLLFMLDLMWGVIQPILLILYMLVIHTLLIIFFTVIGFYLLYVILSA